MSRGSAPGPCRGTLPPRPPPEALPPGPLHKGRVPLESPYCAAARGDCLADEMAMRKGGGGRAGAPPRTLPGDAAPWTPAKGFALWTPTKEPAPLESAYSRCGAGSVPPQKKAAGAGSGGKEGTAAARKRGPVKRVRIAFCPDAGSGTGRLRVKAKGKIKRARSPSWG